MNMSTPLAAESCSENIQIQGILHNKSSMSRNLNFHHYEAQNAYAFIFTKENIKLDKKYTHIINTFIFM